VDRGDGADDQDQGDDAHQGLEQRLAVESGDQRRAEEQDGVEDEAQRQVDDVDRREIPVAGVLRPDQRAGQAAVDEKLRDGDEDAEHPDQTVVRRAQQTRQDDADDEIDAARQDLLDKTPGRSLDRLLFERISH